VTDALPFEMAGFDPRMALLHDSLLNSRGLLPLVDLLSTDHEVVTMDLSGHGRAARRHQSTHARDCWQQRP